MPPPQVSPAPTDHVAGSGPSGSDTIALYVYGVPSVAVVGAALEMVGALFTAVMFTVVFCVVHWFGVPPSQTCTEMTQLAGGTGPACVNVKTPVPALMLPPHVFAAVNDHVTDGPSGSDAV